MNGRRESNRPRAERQAAVNRAAGVESRYRRCPRCKKLRMYVLPSNWRYGARETEKFTDWVKLDDGTQICHLCANAPPLHTIESDGITVWVNGAGGLLGRFGKTGIDIHKPMEDQHEKGECLFCTHEFVTAKDWPIFRAKMLEHFNIKVPNRFLPARFK